MGKRTDIIEKIFHSRHDNGLWTLIPESHKYYPDFLHYVPTYRGTLWALLLLADLKCDPNDERIKKPLEVVKKHLFDDRNGMYSLKEDHFPIPCLNGNMLYLDAYFNGQPDDRSRRVLEFFHVCQRFDDGVYQEPKHPFCSNTSCYGKHTCYWGVVKLLKGISFIPPAYRTEAALQLREKCIRFILLHQVCFSSHNTSKIMVDKMDLLTFPNFYKSDFLEILWLLQREGVVADALIPAFALLQSKQRSDGQWPLERVLHNMVAPVGQIHQPNAFVTERALQVLEYYQPVLRKAGQK